MLRRAEQQMKAGGSVIGPVCQRWVLPKSVSTTVVQLVAEPSLWERTSSQTYLLDCQCK